MAEHPLPGIGPSHSSNGSDDASRVFFQQDRLYSHNILRINYTTYDVRRAQDTISPKTNHRDIMVLVDNSKDAKHPFRYARVLGIYHVNVQYAGSGMIDFTPRRMEFLWVRWFQQYSGPTSSPTALERLSFPPMARKEAFGFIDPNDVLRSCHVIPAFSQGPRYGKEDPGLSRSAQDSGDWKAYYFNQCVSPPSRSLYLPLIYSVASLTVT